MTMDTPKKCLISLCVVMIAGCSSSKPTTPIYPEPEITTKEVYSGIGGSTMGGASQQVLMRTATEQEMSVDPYTLHNSPRTNYRMLDNPTMYLFVNTHISTEYNVPIPAYITEFKLLERDEYALPGESNLTNWSND